MSANPDNITGEQLCAVFILDAPVPCSVLQPIYGSRSTFHVWKKQGLDIRNLQGLGPCVIPSEFKAFLMKKWGHFQPPAKST
jgi:hypothetical protein